MKNEIYINLLMNYYSYVEMFSFIYLFFVNSIKEQIYIIY